MSWGTYHCAGFVLDGELAEVFAVGNERFREVALVRESAVLRVWHLDLVICVRERVWWRWHLSIRRGPSLLRRDGDRVHNVVSGFRE